MEHEHFSALAKRRDAYIANKLSVYAILDKPLSNLEPKSLSVLVNVYNI